jgi:hypothetical protein
MVDEPKRPVWKTTPVARDNARRLRRDLSLKSEGFDVLRFSNHDVLTNKSGVLEAITTAIQERAPSPPSPASGGEEIEGGEAS